MPCLIKTPMRSDLEETTRQKKQTNKQSKNENFTAEIEYLTLKAQSDNAKMQSDKICLLKFNFSYLYSGWKVFLMRLSYESTKRKINEAKFKN